MNPTVPYPPVAKTIPFSYEHLGRAYQDPYAWLQDKEDPEVIAYLQAENDYARINLQHTADLQARLYQEMKGRLKEADSSAPALYGDFYYYNRTQEGQQYRLFCRKKGSLEATEELLLDENSLAQGLEYCRVFYFQPSPNNQFLAYGVDVTGSLVFNLYIKDLTTSQIVDGPIAKTAWDVAWASDSRNLFYTIFDESHRPFKLLRHAVGSDPLEDKLVFHETDDAFNLTIERTRSGKYILLTSRSATTSEVRFLPAGQPTGAFSLVHPRQQWLEYYLEHHGERFLIRCNEEAENFKLMEAPLSNPTKEHWRELVAHRSDTLLESVAAFQEHLVLFERRGGLQQVRISAPDAVTQVHEVVFPDPAYAITVGENRQFNATSFRFTYSSLVTPESTIDYEMQGRKWVVKKKQEIPSGYDPSQYASERLHAVAPDGTQVPISLVYLKGFKRDGSHPLVLYGYGSYGYSADPNFNQQRFSLLDRGFVYAIAHIRGGSEMGRSWYENGRLMNKKNTFTDFIACADHLAAQGYSSPERMAIMGGSAGGLLVSAVTNMRPDLCKAVVALVPFTNVITAMLDRDLPLTVIEWEQWGHPDDPTAFAYMASYSPYENVAAKDYPNIYVKTGLNDLQVPYWDPAKWVARLRVMKTDQNKLLLVTNLGAGHGGASGRFDYLREVAQYMAFLIDTLGAPYDPIP
jgi:oligopeptidase B